ncbi:FadR/GntR family transcriptional regulator [Pseudactinotalea suaedae]|uniref:FadR/GntR family transcriptional regulator n=1 Tax=Pseudactinotalea suaedae TaxID=1524924 RepID=UPI001F4F6C8B|nr:FadR/GntR family transcriptional regulator [Pseudactinotalea suaedae]
MTSRSEPTPALARSQTDVVIDAVKAMLRDGTLRAGDRLPIERELALRLGVSRGSLREAVRALVALGVLESRQGDGTYVTSLDPARMLSPIGFFAELLEPSSAAEVLAVRRMLEVESVALAATRLTADELTELEAILARVDAMLADPDHLDPERTIEADVEFHHLIARASGNSALAGLVDNLSSRTVRARLWRSVNQADSISIAHQQHRSILVALVARDPDRARVRMSSHLLDVEEFVAAHHREVSAAEIDPSLPLLDADGDGDPAGRPGR